MEKHKLKDGGYLAYEYTKAKDKPTVLFLNGVLMNLRMWNSQVENFSDGFSCLVHDFRGQMHSSKMLPEGWCMHDHIADTLSLLDALGIEDCHLVGTSYGGEIALLLAHDAPHRVRSLSIIASVAHSDALLKRQVALWRDLASLGHSGLLYDAVLSTSYAPAFLERHGSFLEQRRSAFQALSPGFFEGFQRLCGAFLSFEMEEEALQAIKVPAYIIAAGQDILKPARYSQYLSGCLPQAEYLCLESAGHAVVVEQPKALYHLIRAFIEKH